MKTIRKGLITSLTIAFVALIAFSGCDRKEQPGQVKGVNVTYTDPNDPVSITYPSKWGEAELKAEGGDEAVTLTDSPRLTLRIIERPETTALSNLVERAFPDATPREGFEPVKQETTGGASLLTAFDVGGEVALTHAVRAGDRVAIATIFDKPERFERSQKGYFKVLRTLDVEPLDSVDSADSKHAGGLNAAELAKARETAARLFEAHALDLGAASPDGTTPELPAELSEKIEEDARTFALAAICGLEAQTAAAAYLERNFRELPAGPRLHARALLSAVQRAYVDRFEREGRTCDDELRARASADLRDLSEGADATAAP